MTIKALLPSPRYTGLDVTESVLCNIRSLLQQTFFFMGAFESSSFYSDINSLKNAICQEIANVTQDTLRHVITSVPGRWQQCLDCHGGHLLATRYKLDGPGIESWCR
jgi:hypothetical protein